MCRSLFYHHLFSPLSSSSLFSTYPFVSFSPLIHPLSLFFFSSSYVFLPNFHLPLLFLKFYPQPLFFSIYFYPRFFPFPFYSLIPCFLFLSFIISSISSPFPLHSSLPLRKKSIFPVYNIFPSESYP